MLTTPRLRKFALTLHVLCSVATLGAVASFLVLALVGLTSKDDAAVRAAYPAMEVIAQTVIVPLVAASFATGIIQSLGTQWGLFRHYWVLTKLAVNVVVMAILLLQMGSISLMADAAASAMPFSSGLRQAQNSLVIHAGGGLLVLLLPVVLSIYKPRGLTRYGWRKQHEPRVT